jgi:hypothetical protein
LTLCKLQTNQNPEETLPTNQSCKFQATEHKTARGRLSGLCPSVFLLMATAGGLMPKLAYTQTTGTANGDTAAATVASEKRPPEQEIIFEGEGSFGNYKIFAQGEDSKLFSSGIEYDRHSWGHFLNAKVYYVAEFLPFVLLNQPAALSYYGTQIPLATARNHVPGIGITPIGIRFLWRDGKAIRPYLMAKGGVLVFTQKAESPNASYENISLQSDIGVQIRMSPRIDLRLGAGDYHFSNAFVVPANPGLDVMSWTSGISYHLGK